MVFLVCNLIFVNNFVVKFYKKEPQVFFSTCKNVMVKKQKLLWNLGVKIKTKRSKNENQNDMKFEGLSVIKRIRKSMPLYNEVQKIKLQKESLSKFVVENPKKMDLFFKTGIKKNKSNKGFSVNLLYFRLGFNLKNKDVYRKKTKAFFRSRVLENINFFKAGVGVFYTNKVKIKLKKYLVSKTSIEKRKSRFKKDKLLKFPFFFKNLTFVQPKLMSLVKNTLNNPIYSSVRKGTFKGFFQILGLKEKTHFFVISRLYRISRLSSYKKYWEKREATRLKLLACIQKTLYFVDKILNFKNFVVNSQFYYRKRWFLYEFYNLD